MSLNWRWFALGMHDLLHVVCSKFALEGQRQPFELDNASNSGKYAYKLEASQTIKKNNLNRYTNTSHGMCVCVS